MYVASFLGAWAAQITESGRHNWQRTVVDSPPIEDAVFQAEETWKRGVDLEPSVFVETGNSI